MEANYNYRVIYRALFFALFAGLTVAYFFVLSLRDVAEGKGARLPVLAQAERSGPSIDEDQQATIEAMSEGIALFSSSMTKIETVPEASRFQGIEVSPPFLVLDLTFHHQLFRAHVIEGTTRVVADRIARELRTRFPLLVFAWRSDENGEEWEYIFNGGQRGLLRYPGTGVFVNVY